MARTPVARFVRNLSVVHAEARRLNVPIDEALGMQTRENISRARFIGGLGALGVLATLPAVARAAAPRIGDHPRIVIVGCGVAGLTCAYRLWQSGVVATLYEANNFVGGRTWSLRGFFDEGQIAEHGGEFISTEHRATRQLAEELGLTLVDVNKAYPPGTVDTNYFNGRRYPMSHAIRDYGTVFDAVHDAEKAAGWPTTWDHHTRAGEELDRTSVAEWIARYVPGGIASSLGKLLGTACLSEYGSGLDDQSALNLIFLLGFERAGHLNLSGTDEAYHIVGGNDQLATTMAGRLPAGAISVGTPLASLRSNADGSYDCRFASGYSSFGVRADHVVLALPFTPLRNVDIGRAGFDALKLRAIRDLQLGSNAKLHLQFTDRHWYREGFTGSSYADTGSETTWEVSVAQRGEHGILVDFPGGKIGASFHAPPHAPASPEVARRFLEEIELVLPGVSAKWNGKAWLDFWAADPWHGGAYSNYHLGQYTSFGGYEGVRQGNVHFCGEHTSMNFQGYIQGAVVSGQRVADELLDAIGIRRSA
jgi:monoamine oxidase